MNEFNYFITLTFDKNKVDRLNDKAVLNCYKIFLKEIRKTCNTFRFITFPERHKKGGLHMLIGGIIAEELGLKFSGKFFALGLKVVVVITDILI